MVYTVLTFEKESQEHNSVTFRNFKHFDESKFIADLICLPAITEVTWPSDELVARWQNFKKEFCKICDKHAPVKVNRLKRRKKPWITSEIISKMYERDYVKKRAVKTKDHELWNYYRKLRNEINDDVKRSKQKYATGKLNDCHGNTKKMWKVLDELTGRKTIKEIPPDLNAQDFNDFFSMIGEHTVSHLPKSPDAELYWKCSKSIHTFQFCDTTVDIVRKHILSIGSESVTDVLGFDGKLLYHACHVIAPIICKFINDSINTNYVLDDWKLSRVTPIY
jgi:hypothetical protein